MDLGVRLLPVSSLGESGWKDFGRRFRDAPPPEHEGPGADCLPVNERGGTVP